MMKILIAYDGCPLIDVILLQLVMLSELALDLDN